MQEQQLLEYKDAGQIESDGSLQEGSEILSLPIERYSFSMLTVVQVKKHNLLCLKRQMLVCI